MKITLNKRVKWKTMRPGSDFFKCFFKMCEREATREVQIDDGTMIRTVLLCDEHAVHGPQEILEQIGAKYLDRLRAEGQ